jgi:hypothetical protein
MIENVYVSVNVMLKGASGILLPLGFENYVTSAQVMLLYNLISIAILFFVAGFSSQREESLFCVLLPIVSGVLIYIGWFRAVDQTGLVAVTVVMFIMGIFIYMTEKNRTMYGTGGSGSKLITIALYIALFTASFTMLSNFSLFQTSTPIVPSGTCVAGVACNANGFDFTTTSAQFSSTANIGGDIVSSATGIAGMIPGLLNIILKMVVGIFAFPVVLNSIVGGMFPGIMSSPIYVGVMSLLGFVIIAVYALGIYELFRGTPGSTI